jgi:protein gp37
VTAQTTYSDLAVWIRGWTGISIPKNIILLTSVENQPMLDKRYKDSVAIPAACRGFSFEPLLSEIIVPDWTGISWAIISGESGPHARPCSVDWIRSLVEQGKAAGVPVFVKQGSGKRAGMQSDIPDDIWAVKEFPNRY